MRLRRVDCRVPVNWSTPAAAAQARPPSPVAANRAHFERYCLTCHTTRQKERGTVPVALDTLDLSRVAADAAAWEKVVLKLRAGVMPPAGAPRPDKADAQRFGVVARRRTRSRAGPRTPNPGRTEPFHRLNRVEYRNAVRDLLGLDLDVSALLPGDDVSYGFDNIAGVLKLSPTLMERYLTAAQKVSRLAVGTPARTPSIDYFRVADDLSQDVQLPGLPLGTRGGTLISYRVPDGRGVRDSPAADSRPEREHAALHRGAVARDQHRRSARGHVHVAGSRCARRSRCPPHRRACRAACSAATVARAGAGASGDLADSQTVRITAKERAVAQPRRRIVESARAGQGRAARRRHHVPQSGVGAR